MNDHDSAFVCSEALKNLSNDPLNDFNHQYLLREARIALAQSAEELENLATLPPQIVEFSIPGTLIINVPFSKNSLAAAYARFGQPQKAIREYERLTTFDSTRTDRYLVNPRDHYFLGLVFENEGMREKAMKEFSRFLEIYTDADQPNKEISDAKRRLALLTGLN